MEGRDSVVPVVGGSNGPAHFAHTHLVLLLLFGLLALVFYRALKWVLALLRMKHFGHAIPGPKASWLSGNSAQMIDAGGLTFFLEYLHDRCVVCGNSDSQHVSSRPAPS